MRRIRSGRRAIAGLGLAILALLSGVSSELFGLCGPFTDVAADSFCPFVLEIFTMGITSGTTPTTYDPSSSVNRLQMAAFLSRTVDGVLRRGSPRAALDQFWTPQNATVLALTTLGGVEPRGIQSDGADLWVANFDNGTVSRVSASDGKLLENWTGAGGALGVLLAMGRVLVTGLTTPGSLYRIDPAQTAGVVTTVATNLGSNPNAIAFDGARFWTQNSNSVSIVTPATAIPWTVTTVTAGFLNPGGVLFDGANVWVTDSTAGTLLKLDSSGAILLTVTVGTQPLVPIYDGTNIWVPNSNSNSVSVVRASTGAVLATLTGNGLNSPTAGAFDGQRVLVTNLFFTVSLWKAADFSPLGSVSVGNNPRAACSDDSNFWITYSTLSSNGRLVRF